MIFSNKVLQKCLTSTMRKLVEWGKLPVLKVGRKTIIRRDTLERFLTVNQGRNLLKPDDVRRVE